MGISQTLELREKDMNDLSSWNKQDFSALKDTLSQLIIYIRFFGISSEDFYNKIWPFKKVLPKALSEDILSLHMSNINLIKINCLLAIEELPLIQ